MPRMRTVKQCFLYIYQQDNETAISEYFIRSLAQKGLVDYRVAGANKLLINLDSLLSYLGCESEKI